MPLSPDSSSPFGSSAAAAAAASPSPSPSPSPSLRSSGFPDWALLNKLARVSDLRNATTAVCRTREGQAVEVSFWFVDPPGVSYFSFHCPGLRDEDYSHVRVSLICAEAAFVLLRVDLKVPCRDSFDFFVYTASGPAGRPSLHLLPHPEVGSFKGKLLGLLPCGEDHYAVAFLDRQWSSRGRAASCPDYYANVFSSETRAWRRSKTASLHLSPSNKPLINLHSPSKQITVGASSLGWVDLLNGILLLSDLFDDRPAIKYIPFPASRVRITRYDNTPYFAAEYSCDVTCCDDLIKFAEIDFEDPEGRTSGRGWKANIWNRKVSWKDWRKHITVDVDQISVDKSYSALLPELLDDETQQLQLKKLNFHIPTLSIHDDDTLYFMATVNLEDDKAWVLALDMKHAALEALVPFSTKWFSYILTYCPCAFPKYFTNMTPGEDIADPVDEYFERMSVTQCLMLVLWTREWFTKFGERLQFERTTYDQCRKPLLRYCPVSSLLRAALIQLENYASCNGEDEAGPKAVDLCLRAFEDFDSLQRKSRSDPPSIVTLRNKSIVACQALDNLVQIVPPTVIFNPNNFRWNQQNKAQDGKVSCEERAIVLDRRLLYFFGCMLLMMNMQILIINLFA